jgi:hypothetical protein
MNNDDAKAAMVRGTVKFLSKKIGAPWTPSDSLPPCPVCGTPRLPGRVGGVLCMSTAGRPRAPHAARVVAWGRELEERARRPKLTLVP